MSAQQVTVSTGVQHAECDVCHKIVPISQGDHIVSLRTDYQPVGWACNRCHKHGIAISFAFRLHTLKGARCRG